METIQIFLVSDNCTVRTANLSSWEADRSSIGQTHWRMSSPRDRELQAVSTLEIAYTIAESQSQI